MNRIRQRMNHFAVWRRRIQLCQIFSHRFSGHRQHVAMQQTCIKQMFHHNRHSTNAIYICHVILAARLCVSNMRHFCCDAIEIIERQRHASLVGDGQQMQHCIRAATECIDNCDCVLECFFGHDVARINAKTQQIDDGRAGALRIVITSRVNGRWRCTAGQTHAECFGNTRHRVCSKHAATGSFAWACLALDFTEFVFAHLAGGARTDRFEHSCDVNVLAVV